MTKIFNIEETKRFRRRLRKEMTTAERILWYKLRDRRFGYKFRRQYSVGKYILDFYCPELKLAIEVDGSSHFTEEGLLHDKIRQEFIENSGIKIVRFTNLQIKSCVGGAEMDLDGIIKTINI